MQEQYYTPKPGGGESLRKPKAMKNEKQYQPKGIEGETPKQPHDIYRRKQVSIQEDRLYYESNESASRRGRRRNRGQSQTRQDESNHSDLRAWQPKSQHYQPKLNNLENPKMAASNSKISQDIGPKQKNSDEQKRRRRTVSRGRGIRDQIGGGPIAAESNKSQMALKRPKKTSIQQNDKSDLLRKIEDAWKVDYTETAKDKKDHQKSKKREFSPQHDYQRNRRQTSINPKTKTTNATQESKTRDFSYDFENKTPYHNFYGEKTDDSQVICLFDTEFANEILDLTLCRNQVLKQLKHNYETMPSLIDSHVQLREIYQGSKSQSEKEQKVYLENPHIFQNFRKYITFIDHAKNGQQKTIIGRKGLPKLFHFSLDYVDRPKRYTYKPQRVKPQKDGYFYTIKNQILAPVKKYILMGDQVQIFRSLKLSGLDCQISWSAGLRAFIICNEQSSIMIRERSQLRKFSSAKKKKINWCLVIANVWFDFLEGKDVDEIELLKKSMDGQTLLATLVAGPAAAAGSSATFQSLDVMVRYSEQRLLFHSIVNNYSRNPTVLPECAYAFFKRYKMDVTPIKSLGICKNYDEICDLMYCAFCETSLATLAQANEGAIIYFVKRASGKEAANTAAESKKDRVISISKIETLEYKILSEMCSKLRSFNLKALNDVVESTALKQNFIRDVRAICGGQFREQLPQSLDFYIDLMLFSISQISIKAKDPAEKQRKEELLNLLEKAEFTQFIDKAQELYSQIEEKEADIKFDSKVADKEEQEKIWAEITKELLNGLEYDDTLLNKPDQELQQVKNNNLRPMFVQMLQYLNRFKNDPNYFTPSQQKELYIMNLEGTQQDKDMKSLTEEEKVTTTSESSKVSKQCNNEEIRPQAKANEDGRTEGKRRQEQAPAEVPQEEVKETEVGPSGQTKWSQKAQNFKKERLESPMQGKVNRIAEGRSVTILYCPPYLLPMQVVAQIKQKYKKLMITQKFTLDLLNRHDTDFILIQSLEGLNTQKGWNRFLTEYILFGQELVDEAVKNQLLHPLKKNKTAKELTKGYFVEESCEGLDSAQLREYFEDQTEMSVYVNSRAAGIKRDKIQHINDLEQLIQHLGLPPYKEMRQKESSQSRPQTATRADDNEIQIKSDTQPLTLNLTKVPSDDWTEELKTSEAATPKQASSSKQKDHPKTKASHDNQQIIKTIEVNGRRNFQKNITLIIPMGIPGIGKTTFGSQLQEHYASDKRCFYSSVSNNELRAQLKEQYLNEFPESTREQAHHATTNLLQTEFLEKLKDELLRLKTEKGRRIEEHVLFLDYDIPPRKLKLYVQAIDTVQQQHEQFISIKKTCLMPFALQPHKLNSQVSYPFSCQVFIKCILRILQRTNREETLSGEDPDLACRVLFGYFNQYQNMNLNQEFLQKYKIDNYLRINLANESADVQLPQNLVDAMNQCLINCQGQTKTPQPDAVYTRLLQLINGYSCFFGGPQSEVPEESQHSIREAIKSIVAKPEKARKQPGKPEAPSGHHDDVPPNEEDSESVNEGGQTAVQAKPAKKRPRKNRAHKNNKNNTDIQQQYPETPGDGDQNYYEKATHPKVSQQYVPKGQTAGKEAKFKKEERKGDEAGGANTAAHEAEQETPGGFGAGAPAGFHAQTPF